MRGQSIFVLVFLSFVGELVLGSLFPSTQYGPPPPPLDSENTQPEVKWPLENIASSAEVIVPAEAKIYSPSLQVEQTKDSKLESDRKSAEILPSIIINPDLEGQIANNTGLEAKNITSDQ